MPHSPTYSVQVGSFRQEGEAGRLTEMLRASGYNVRLVRVTGARGLWHQVLVGPYTDMDLARQDQLKVRQMPGYGDARLITH